MLDADA